MANLEDDEQSIHDNLERIAEHGEEWRRMVAERDAEIARLNMLIAKGTAEWTRDADKLTAERLRREEAERESAALAARLKEAEKDNGPGATVLEGALTLVRDLAAVSFHQMGAAEAWEALGKVRSRARSLLAGGEPAVPTAEPAGDLWERARAACNAAADAADAIKQRVIGMGCMEAAELLRRATKRSPGEPDPAEAELHLLAAQKIAREAGLLTERPYQDARLTAIESTPLSRALYAALAAVRTLLRQDPPGEARGR